MGLKCTHNDPKFSQCFTSAIFSDSVNHASYNMSFKLLKISFLASTAISNWYAMNPPNPPASPGERQLMMGTQLKVIGYTARLYSTWFKVRPFVDRLTQHSWKLHRLLVLCGQHQRRRSCHSTLGTLWCTVHVEAARLSATGPLRRQCMHDDAGVLFWLGLRLRDMHTLIAML